MKRIQLLILLPVLCLVISGCQIGEKGSGNLIKETRDVSNFNKIHLEDSGNILLWQGDTESCEVETDDNLLPLIKTSVSTGMLQIRPDRTIDPTELNIYLTMININGFEIEGSGNIASQTPIITNELALNISGSGNINIDDFEADSLYINIEGSGNITMTGTSDAAYIVINGSGNIELLDLEVKRVTVIIRGSGSINVWATQKLDALIEGSGNITYKGNPSEKRTRIDGSGEVKQIN